MVIVIVVIVVVVVVVVEVVVAAEMAQMISRKSVTQMSAKGWPDQKC